MKILFLSYYYWPPHFGGGLLHTIERLETLAFRGHQVNILTSGAKDFERSKENNNYLIQRSVFTKTGGKFQKAVHHIYFFFWSLIRLARDQYDIVQIGSLPGFNTMSAMICGIIYSWVIHTKKARSVYLYSLAESETEAIVMSGLIGHFRKRFLNQIDAIIVNSPWLLDHMDPIFPSRVKLILNGVRDEAFRPNEDRRKLVREENLIDNQSIVFSFLGTISYRKGIDVLLKAFTDLQNSLSNCKLWLIGPYTNDENQNYVDANEKQLIDAALTTSGVKLWGRINERKVLVGLLNASDIFVFPTRREGMPMAPLQAMASGLPVIITRIPGVTDLANIEGETGRYTEMNNVESLRRAMLELASDCELRKKMGHAARKIIEKHFCWDNHVDNWEELYTSLTNSKL